MTSSETAERPVVEMTGISIEFPGVKALDQVDLRLFPGEVHALMGENGAGKSTLIKALTGVYGIDAGEILVDGRSHRFSGPGESQDAGIATVYQEVNLCENLTVAENIMLGNEPRRLGAIDWRATRREAARHLATMGLDIDPASSLGAHSIALQQLVAISRAMVVEAKVLILDEPTSSLDAGEVAQLFAVMRRLRDEGVAILFVSHFIEQVYEISDRMTVLRNGRLVGEYATATTDRVELVSTMIGRSMEVLEDLHVSTDRTVEIERGSTPYLQAVGLGRKGSVQPFDLDVYSGEVVGLAGLLGSGRTEVARLLAGADRADSGTTRIKDAPAPLRNPRAAISRGIAFSSEDRKAEGVVGDLTVRENIVLGLQAGRGWMRRLPGRQVDEIVDKYVAALNIRPADPDALLRNLSGGNQQKVLLARWLATAPELLILDEPTRGIDVGAKAEIQKLVAELAGEGMAVVFISAELEEVLRLSHRIAVMRDRAKVAEIVNGEDVGVDEVVGLIASGGDH
ncbi:monosaccharide ABC transporter ATP-binding protein (CUT2 family) [Isoptericola sp. CG 20/1183]|uniref:Monosaccharide ABC transporter ATP-binding protein (CUT2 family) n=1 Tax=Isoptericola halotolerans TaxID=300560 RepID=A0ABX5EHC2_9MICO|nr:MULTISPECIES: sugar ABC transporter ATP-binding protein [Isoptericola]PRZ06921.1 monosaccharide ABC transporter ATP-binding protein (CUT2 family) [Isoptericola halotolerans]PRZ07407.1 monosaccharide ABC transporter ATP-binding protein (CUT2 family) [Isoptericola sp. CG 20/1183]